MAEQNRDRPYDPEQLQKLTDHLQGRDARVVDAPEPEQREHIIHRPGFEPHSGGIREDAIALGGSARRFFSGEGRAERRATRQARSQQREEVLGHVSDRITNPRQTDDPKENIGWVGTGKREVEVEGAPDDQPAPADTDSEGFSNLGKTLFPKPPAPPTAPNQLRPATRSELAADKRIDKGMRKGRKARMQRNWLEDSYDGELDAGAGHRLSRAEKRHMRHVAKQAQKLDRRAARADRQFERAATTRNGAHYLLESVRSAGREAAARIGLRRGR